MVCTALQMLNVEIVCLPPVEEPCVFVVWTSYAIPHSYIQTKVLSDSPISTVIMLLPDDDDDVRVVLAAPISYQSYAWK